MVDILICRYSSFTINYSLLIIHYYRFDTFQGFRQFIVFGTERDTDIPFPVASEDESGRDEYAGFV